MDFRNSWSWLTRRHHLSSKTKRVTEQIMSETETNLAPALKDFETRRSVTSSALLLILLPILIACETAPVSRDVESRMVPFLTLESIHRGEAQTVDLTYSLDESNPYWPADNYEPFSYEIIATLERDRVLSGAFSMPEHLGTHLDAPNHFVEGQIPVDEIPLQRLVAPIVVVDVRSAVAQDSDYQLTTSDLTSWEERNGPIPAESMVFALTGWGERWSDFESYKNADEEGTFHFPGFSAESAEWLVKQRQIAGLGIDTLSVDPGTSEDFPVHRIVHGSGGYHIENTARLEQVPEKGAWLLAAPIKISGGTGGPARCWAIFPSF